ncbi:AsnC family transcriptional regulator [Mycobacteroides franklinii]|uniref:AsnC family transcriptional regulator n=1 Tax=Mycobacteroides franklinii TaxID=948102 RepID=UPI0019D576A1
MKKMRQSLDETERRIVAALMASPRASWRTIAEVLGVSERTVVRRAAPLLHDGTLRATAVRTPSSFPDLIPLALRIRCQPNRVSAIAATLARRSDSLWVDVLGGGDEICVMFHLRGPAERNNLLLHDLPATSAVQSWTSHVMLKVFPADINWSAGLLTATERTALRHRAMNTPNGSAIVPFGDPMIAALVDDGRASYADLADRTGTTALTARRRLNTLLDGGFLRLVTEIDLALLGIGTEALIWMNVAPAHLGTIADQLSRHPEVRLVAATTGPHNLLVAVAVADLAALYCFLTETIGDLAHITAMEVTPTLTGLKRAGQIRPGSL